MFTTLRSRNNSRYITFFICMLISMCTINYYRVYCMLETFKMCTAQLIYFNDNEAIQKTHRRWMSFSHTNHNGEFNFLETVYCFFIYVFFFFIEYKIHTENFGRTICLFTLLLASRCACNCTHFPSAEKGEGSENKQITIDIYWVNGS